MCEVNFNRSHHQLLCCRLGGDSPEAAQESFGTVYGSFLSLFSAMTGNYDLDVFHGLRWPVLSTALYMLYIVAQVYCQSKHRRGERR